MANIKSKEKNIKRIEKATFKNRVMKSRVRKAIKNTKLAADSNSPELNDKLKIAKKTINKAVSKGVLHKNNGARKASRIDSYVSKRTTSNA